MEERMRRQLPLVASLAFVAAVGCVEQPMEPEAQSGITQPILSAAHSAQQYVWTNQEVVIDLCGIDEVQFLGTVRGHRRDSGLGDQGPTFQQHTYFIEVWDMNGVGYETGLEWSLNAVLGDWDFRISSIGNHVYTTRTVWNIIGKGDVPSFQWFVLAHLTFNTAGELVARQVRVEPICD
jgi:hypothetical protein